MPQVFPDGDYSHGATWMNASDRVAWQRSFQVGTDQTKRMAAAMLMGDPDTPGDVIRAATTAPVITQRGMKTSPTIDDILNTGPSGYDPGHLYDRAPTDYGNSTPAAESSSVPSLPVW